MNPKVVTFCIALFLLFLVQVPFGFFSGVVLDNISKSLSDAGSTYTAREEKLSFPLSYKAQDLYYKHIPSNFSLSLDKVESSLSITRLLGLSLTAITDAEGLGGKIDLESEIWNFWSDELLVGGRLKSISLAKLPPLNGYVAYGDADLNFNSKLKDIEKGNLNISNLIGLEGQLSVTNAEISGGLLSSPFSPVKEVSDLMLKASFKQHDNSIVFDPVNASANLGKASGYIRVGFSRSNSIKLAKGEISLALNDFGFKKFGSFLAVSAGRQLIGTKPNFDWVLKFDFEQGRMPRFKVSPS